MEKKDIINNETLIINITSDDINVTGKIKMQRNRTLGELRQKLINNIYDKEYYDQFDVEILKILFK